MSGFLPKKFGVTSGYIVSASYYEIEDHPITAPHFDVIIYDVFESPTLWIEGDPGKSEVGKSRAIPAEYVRGVIEIKSQWTPQTAKDAMEQLQKLQPYFPDGSKPQERQELLPEGFCCGVVFFELLADHLYSERALGNLVPNPWISGFSGGIVLRGSGLDDSQTGRILPFGIDFGEGKTPKLMGSNIGRGRHPLTDGGYSDRVVLENIGERNMNLIWGDAHFSRFAFELIDKLNGRWGEHTKRDVSSAWIHDHDMPLPPWAKSFPNG